MVILNDYFTKKYDTSKYYNKENLKNIKIDLDYSLLNNIVSPLENNNIYDLLIEINNKSKLGSDHVLYDQYCSEDKTQNILVPYFCSKKKNICELIIINNPDDIERLSRKHVKKMPNFEVLFHDSIISTTDNEHWRSQRDSLISAFNPNNSLEKIIPISYDRAKKCSDILSELSNNGNNKININDFFLYETLSQLQLAMFGFSEDFNNKTNLDIRNGFAGLKEEGYMREYSKKFLEEIKKSSGPLSINLNNRIEETETELYGNALILSFAGHDTTGHTLTWLIFELAKNLNYQIKLQNEIDNFWKEIGNNEIKISDFKKLPFMTRCIMETLRLWPAVPNGSFRELISDDEIMGKNNGKVKIKKGTYIQIFNWTRHRSKELWGEDSEIFNPERNFDEDEIWDDTGFATYNPYTGRFSPFSLPPRDCLGKNFAQIEMRLILLNVLKDFNFILTKKQTEEVFNNNYFGINRATLAPANVYNKEINLKNKGLKPYQTGLYVYAIPRNHKAKL